MVCQIDNNNYLEGDQPKEYRLVVSRYLPFMRIELVEVIILEALILGT
jgi:hypothetical protein